MGMLDSLTGGGSKKAKAKIEEGVALAEKGEFSEAITRFDEAIRFDQKNPEAYYLRANTKMQKGRREEAIKDFSEAILHEPGHSRAWGGRGLAKVQLGRLPEAISDFNEAIRLNPSSALLFYNLGSARFKLGQYQEALSAYDSALKLNDGHAGALYARGKTLAALGRKEDAIADFTEVIRVDPKNPKPYARRGILKSELRRHGEALADLDRAISLNPNYALAYFNRAGLRNKVKMKEEALQDFNEAIRLDPKNALAYYNRGNSHFSLGKYEEAIKDYNKALKFDSTMAWAYYSRSATLMFTGDREKGKKDLEIFVQLTENSLTGSSKIRDEAIKHLETLKNSETLEASQIQKGAEEMEAMKEESFKGPVLREGEGIREQKFEAIMFLDICKSTNLIDGYGELHYFSNVVAVLEKPLQELKRQYSCVFEKSTGDGYMFTFNDCTNALNLAVSIMQLLERHNSAAEDPAQGIDVRIGMDCGQIIVKESDRDRIGDAANIAKRVEGLMRDSFVELTEEMRGNFPEKNRIFISAKVLTMLGDNPSFKHSEIGWAELKGKVGVRYQIHQIDWKGSKPGASPGSTIVKI